MLKISAVRWGQPYESLDKQNIVHFLSGEPIAEVSQINGGIVTRDMRTAHKARATLREFSIVDLMAKVAKAADFFENQTLPIGDGTQSPAEFVQHQSASTGLPEHMCAANMAKNCFVLRNMPQILDAD